MLDRVHLNIFPKATMRMYVKPGEVNDDVKRDEVKDDVKSNARSVVVEVDDREQFINKQECIVREHTLQWVRMKAEKLEFGFVIGMSDNGSDKRQAFVTMRCDKIGTYQPPIKKLKHDNIKSRKCECQFKLHGYHKVNDTWKFNVVSGIHNHVLCQKLVNNPIVCHLIPEKKELVLDMTLNMVALKNILATLK